MVDNATGGYCRLMFGVDAFITEFSVCAYRFHREEQRQNGGKVLEKWSGWQRCGADDEMKMRELLSNHK